MGSDIGMKESKHFNRRSFVKTISTIGAVGLAGCAGQGDDSDDAQNTTTETTTTEKEGGDDNSGQEWNPSVVENMVPVEPGDLRSQVPRLWMEYATDHYGTNTSITNNPGAQSLINMNDAWNAEPNGEVLGTWRAVPCALYQVGRDEAEYNVEDFNFVLRYLGDTRAIQINPRTTPVENHWDWTWDDMVEYARSEGLTFGVAGGHHRMALELLRRWEPRLKDLPKEEHWHYINFDGGSAARAAIERGDIDGYCGGYNSNISARTNFYKTQGPVFNGPELFPDIAERQQTLIKPEDNPDATLPDEHFLTNTSFPNEEAKKAVNIILDGIVAALPPETPDHIVQAHNEALQATAKEEGLQKDVAEAFSEYAFAPAHGQDVQKFVENKTRLVEEEVSDIVEGMF